MALLRSGELRRVNRPGKMDSATLRRMTKKGETVRPVARELGETSLMLLVHPTLTEQNIEDTIRVVKDVICRATK